MTEATLRLIGQEIRHQAEALRERSRWLQDQPEGALRREGFQHVNFWRNVLRDAELRFERLTAEHGAIHPIAVNT